jgi:hypothetical protein
VVSSSGKTSHLSVQTRSPAFPARFFRGETKLPIAKHGSSKRTRRHPDRGVGYWEVRGLRYKGGVVRETTEALRTTETAEETMPFQFPLWCSVFQWLIRGLPNWRFLSIPAHLKGTRWQGACILRTAPLSRPQPSLVSQISRVPERLHGFLGKSAIGNPPWTATTPTAGTSPSSITLSPPAAAINRGWKGSGRSSDIRESTMNREAGKNSSPSPEHHYTHEANRSHCI